MRMTVEYSSAIALDGPLHRHDQRELADQRAGARDHLGAGAVIDAEGAALDHESGIGIVALVEQIIAAGDVARSEPIASMRSDSSQQAQGRDTLEQRYVIVDRHQR